MGGLPICVCVHIYPDSFDVVFIQSLDDSLNSSLLAPVMESLQVELASLKEDIKSKDKVQGSLEEQMKVLSEEKDKLTKELISIRDKLNVAEVRANQGH